VITIHVLGLIYLILRCYATVSCNDCLVLLYCLDVFTDVSGRRDVLAVEIMQCYPDDIFIDDVTTPPRSFMIQFLKVCYDD
jgi:hypothetical protein